VQQDVVEQLEQLILRLGTLTARREGYSRTAAATLTRLADGGPRRLTELAVAEGVTQPSMSSLVARLVDQRLVARDPDPHDARAVLLRLTPDGDRLVAQRRADRAQRLDRALAELDPADVGRIADALPALTQLAGVLRRSSSPTEVVR
jgi:DNA-binding MarR family transcriptional regulator